MRFGVPLVATLVAVLALPALAQLEPQQRIVDEPPPTKLETRLRQ